MAISVSTWSRRRRHRDFRIRGTYRPGLVVAYSQPQNVVARPEVEFLLTGKVTLHDFLVDIRGQGRRDAVDIRFERIAFRAVDLHGAIQGGMLQAVRLFLKADAVRVYPVVNDYFVISLLGGRKDHGLKEQRGGNRDVKTECYSEFLGPVLCGYLGIALRIVREISCAIA